jgi:oxygen tolerance protein BatD
VWAQAQAGDGGAGAVAAAPAPVDPDAPTIAARADRQQAHVGDRIRISVVAVAKTAIPVNLPGTLDLGAFSVLSREDGPVQNLGDGRVRREFTLTVAAYEPGEAQLPAIEVTYLGARGDVKTVRTEPLAIKIASLIANEPEPALKEGTTQVSVLEENRVPLYVGGGVLAAALGALISFLIVRKLRMRPGERPGPPPRPAHEIALERLDRLGAYGFIENADNRPFYFAVSEIIRDYLGGRYGFDSLEMTTDELGEELRQRAGRELVLSEVKGWLAACDLVKFAKVSPSVTEARGTLESAIRIVTTSRPVPEPLAPHPAPPATEARHA